MPTQFAVDHHQLQANLRALQSQFHPDSQKSGQITNNIAQQLLANLNPEQQSAVINEAYQTLLSEDSRAKHLLALQGIEQSINQPIRDLDFLDDAMEYRIALDEATVAQLPSMRAQLGNWLSHWSNMFTQAYDKIVASDTAATDDVNQALDSLQKLQFLVKLGKDVDKRHDELVQDAGSDDDLYVWRLLRQNNYVTFHLAFLAWFIYNGVFLVAALAGASQWWRFLLGIGFLLS